MPFGPSNLTSKIRTKPPHRSANKSAVLSCDNSMETRGYTPSQRDDLNRFRQQGSLASVNKLISKHLEISDMLKALKPQPLLCHKVSESHFPVMGNLCTQSKPLRTT